MCEVASTPLVVVTPVLGALALATLLDRLGPAVPAVVLVRGDSPRARRLAFAGFVGAC